MDVRRYDIEMRKMLRRMIPPPVGIDRSAGALACDSALLARTHRHCGTSVSIFAVVSGGDNQVWEICCIHQNVASAKMVATLFGLDAHPTTGDVADLLLLGMTGYMIFSAGNNSVIGRKHRLKHGIVSNQSSWPSLRACFFLYKVACALTQGCHLGVHRWPDLLPLHVEHSRVESNLPARRQPL